MQTTLTIGVKPLPVSFPFASGERLIASPHALFFRDGCRVYAYFHYEPRGRAALLKDFEILKQIANGDRCSLIIQSSGDRFKKICCQLFRYPALKFFAVAGVVDELSGNAFKNQFLFSRKKRFEEKVFMNAQLACHWLNPLDGMENKWSHFSEMIESHFRFESKILESGFEVKIYKDLNLVEIKQSRVNTEVNSEQTKELLDLIREEARQRGCYISVISCIKNISSASGTSQKDASVLDCVDKLALVFSDRKSRIIGKFFITVFKQSYPVRIFPSRSDAIDWIFENDIPRSFSGRTLDEKAIATDNRPCLAQKDFDAVLDALMAYSKRDFSRKIKADEIENEDLRLIAKGVNYLGSELKATMISKKGLEKERIFLDLVVENMPLPVFIKDVEDEFRVVAWNREAESAFGRSKQEMVGKTAKDVLRPSEAQASIDLDRAAFESGNLTEEPMTYLFVPGKGSVPFSIKKIPIRDCEGSRFRYLLVLAEDLSEKLKAEEKRRAADVAAFTASRLASLTEMAAGVAHEINNPLEVIQGRVELIRRAYQSDLSLTNDLDLILKMVSRVAGVITGLRAFSKDVSAEPMRETSVKEVVEVALGFCHERLKNHGIELRMSSISSRAKLKCHDSEIAQVFVSLLNNAHDAVVGLDEKWIVFDCKDLGDQYEFSVTDSGSGIDPAVRSKVFQPFFSTKEVGKGTGLGLSISKGLVEVHHGTIEIDEKSENTRFIVRLPKEPSTRPL